MICKNVLMAATAALLLFSLTNCKKSESKVVTDTEATDGQIFLSPYNGGDLNSGQLLVLDKDGNTIMNKKTEAETFNFEKWVVNGKTRYTYLVHDPNAYAILFPSITPCQAVVLDENFNEIDRVSLMPYNERTTDDPNSVDSHEFVYIDDHHYIVESYYEKRVSNIPSSLNAVPQCKVVAPIIQEINNGTVVFEWDGSTFPEFYAQSQEGNQFSDSTVVHDYMHLNSIFIDPKDNNLICSFRHLNQIVKINRNTGNIIWRLGGTNSDFPVTSDMKFLRQHHATLTDSSKTLLIYDNGLADVRPYTRIDEFKLDETARTVSSFKSFTLPLGVFSQYMGSVQKRGDTYFIGCGSDPKIMEVNYNTGKVNFLMTLSNNTYRAFKY